MDCRGWGTIKIREEAGTVPGVWLVMGWWDFQRRATWTRSGFGEEMCSAWDLMNVRDLEDVHEDNGLPVRLAGPTGSWERQL